MCITKELLVKFYGDSAFFAMRTLIHYRVLATFGKPFDYFLVEKPWRVKCWRKPSADTTQNYSSDC